MRRLPNEKIEKNELYSYYQNDINLLGSEGIVLLSKDSLISRKIFHEAIIDESFIGENKLNKLQLLYQIKDFLQDIKILKTISCEGKFVGYDTISKYPHQRITTPDKEKIIKYLKQTKKLLDYFHSQDIVFGDVKKSNILLSKETNICSFCDLDNIQIKNFPIDTFNKYIFDFIRERNLVSLDADVYMHNLLVLQMLFYENEDYSFIIDKLLFTPETIEKYFTKEAEKDIICMQEHFLDYKGGYLIDNLDESKVR